VVDGGVFGTVPVSALSPCNGGNLPNFGTTFTSTGFMPAIGSKIHLTLARYAVLVGHASGASQIFVVDTTNMQQIGTTITISTASKARRWAAMAEQSTRGGHADALGRWTDVRRSGGALRDGALDGMLSATPSLVLNDAQPEAGEEFGHAVATMKFNGQEIVVVGAHDEVFAYYKTALYDALPAK